MSGLDVLVVPSTHTESMLTPIASGQGALGRVECVIEMGYREAAYRGQTLWYGVVKKYYYRCRDLDRKVGQFSAEACE